MGGSKTVFGEGLYGMFPPRPEFPPPPLFFSEEWNGLLPSILLQAIVVEYSPGSMGVLNRLHPYNVSSTSVVAFLVFPFTAGLKALHS